MKRKKTPFQLNLRQLAKDLRENKPLIYPVTFLTGGDGRRRSTVQRVMQGLDLGEYHVETDTWMLDPDKAVLYLAQNKKPPPAPFELDLRQLATHLLEDHPLVYDFSELPGAAGCRRSLVQLAMIDLDLGTYDAERVVWVLDRSKVLEHLAARFASERGAETVEHLAVVQVHQRAFREQVLSYFALKSEKAE